MAEFRPLCIIEDDEELEYVVGDTTFVYRRILRSERDALRTLFRERGKLDQQGYDMAIMTTGLVRWRQLWGKNGEIAWPETETVAKRRQQTLLVLEKLPLDIAETLLTKMSEPSPEELLKNWNALSNANGTLPTDGPESATNVPIVEESAPNSTK